MVFNNVKIPANCLIAGGKIVAPLVANEDPYLDNLPIDLINVCKP